MTYTTTDPQAAAEHLVRLVRSCADIETIEAVAAVYGPTVDGPSCAALAYELADWSDEAARCRTAQSRAEYRSRIAAARGQQASANRSSAAALDWSRLADLIEQDAADTLAALVALLAEGSIR